MLGTIGLGGIIRWGRHAGAREHARDVDAARHSLLSIQDQLERGILDGADGEAQALYDQLPDTPEACLVLAHASFKTPDVRGQMHGVEVLQRELQEHPARAECAALLAEIHRRMDEQDAATRLEGQAAAGQPDTGAAWYVRSFATRDPNTALRYARQAVKHAPAWDLAWGRVARLCLLAGELDEAQRAGETLLRLGADRVDWSCFLARILLRQDRLAEALERYSAAIDDQRLDSRPYVERAHVQRRRGHYSEAVADYDRGIALIRRAGKSPVWVLHEHAVALWILRQPEAAIKHLWAIRNELRGPFYDDARLYLILREQGARDDADQVLARALRKIADADPWLQKVFWCLAGQLAPAEFVRDAKAHGTAE